MNIEEAYFNYLQNEVKELAQKIDKAIEYLKQDGIYFEERDTLLEILGDKENEET